MNNSYTINRESTNLFSGTSNELSYRQSTFTNFIQQPFSKEAFGKQILLKKANYPHDNRKVLVDVLKKQYELVEKTSIVSKNIDLLANENTFTITTGHQLSLFTGPLYFIYKIIHVIKLCDNLKELYPENNFVPVFWLASEDHDFKEINHFRLFGKKIEWNSEQKGPVGRFDIEHLAVIKQELHDFFKNHPDSEIHHLIDTYQGKNLSEAHFQFVHSLFKEYGLVIVEPDNRELKKLFSPIIEKELFDPFGEKCVNDSTQKLQSLNYKGQVFPRPINFFWIEKGIRERVQYIDNHFFIAEKGAFTTDEMRTLVQNNPENFSPNVIFRPVYQEVILPNLCYVGGGGEMAYWLQLKEVFDKANIVYPLIQVRNSLQLIDANASKKMNKFNLQFEDFLADIDTIKKNFIKQNTSDSVDFNDLKLKVDDLKNAFVKTISTIDPQLEKFIEIENLKLDKQLEAIEAKVLRVQKQKMETDMKQLEDIKNRLFPNSNLQERSENFLNFCPSGNVSDFIQKVHQQIQPLTADFIVTNIN